MKYLRRLVWFIASRLFWLVALLGLMVVVFCYAMNAADIHVVLKDGMALRAETIMGEVDGDELTKYFSPGFLEHDAALQTAREGNSAYANYTIRGIDHRLSAGFFWVWPWDTTVRVEMTERIPSIDGRAKGSKAEALVAQYGSEALYPPAWQAARYRVILTLENDAWHIVSLTQLELLAD